MIEPMSLPTVVIFANPIAGRGRAMQVSEALQKHLRKHFDVEHFALPPATVEIARFKQLGPLHAALSIGGDGTLQGVTEWLLELTDQKPPPILVVPLGTANLIAKHLELPWRRTRDVEQIRQALLRRKVVNLDASRCNGKIFLAVAGVGFDAQVVHALHQRRSGPITKASYAMPTLETLAKYRFPRVRVIVDDKEVFPAAPALVYVGNVPEYGTGFPMLPHARSDDHLLDVCVLPCRNRQQAVQWMMMAASDMHPQAEGAVYTRGKKVRIETKDSVPIQLDGEAAGHTPAMIELLDVRLPFVVAP